MKINIKEFVKCLKHFSDRFKKRLDEIPEIDSDNLGNIEETESLE